MNYVKITEGERIKALRKSLGLTQEEFGLKVGLKRNSISQLESGTNSVTEQMRKSICREFSVDYAWLTTGKGDMFDDEEDVYIEKIDRIMTGESEIRRNFFKALINASNEDVEALDRIIDEYVKFRNASNEEKD